MLLGAMCELTVFRAAAAAGVVVSAAAERFVHYYEGCVVVTVHCQKRSPSASRQDGSAWRSIRHTSIYLHWYRFCSCTSSSGS
jgi:hypothetical protein